MHTLLLLCWHVEKLCWDLLSILLEPRDVVCVCVCGRTAVDMRGFLEAPMTARLWSSSLPPLLGEQSGHKCPVSGGASPARHAVWSLGVVTGIWHGHNKGSVLHFRTIAHANQSSFTTSVKCDACRHVLLTTKPESQRTNTNQYSLHNTTDIYVQSEESGRERFGTI